VQIAIVVANLILAIVKCHGDCLDFHTGMVLHVALAAVDQ
jgi:hypothetical protein